MESELADRVGRIQVNVAIDVTATGPAWLVPERTGGPRARAAAAAPPPAKAPPAALGCIARLAAAPARTPLPYEHRWTSGVEPGIHLSVGSTANYGLRAACRGRGSIGFGRCETPAEARTLYTRKTADTREEHPLPVRLFFWW